jgi:hypothetical protein
MRHRDQLRKHPRLGLRFGRRFASALGRRRPRPGDKWLVDEVFIRIRGRQHRLRRKVDQDGHVLDILMQNPDCRAGLNIGLASGAADLRRCVTH